MITQTKLSMTFRKKTETSEAIIFRVLEFLTLKIESQAKHTLLIVEFMRKAILLVVVVTVEKKNLLPFVE
jgi:hypothetical protein